MRATVIIPTYKPQWYIYECLTSIFTQTMDSLYYEVIIVLNGCNEPYFSELKNYIANKDNIHLLQTDVPGVSNARNLALDYAKGEVILFIDDDDTISSDYIKEMTARVSDDNIVVSRLRLFDSISKQEYNTNLTLAYDIARERLKKKPLTLFSGRRLISALGGTAISLKLIGNNRFNTKFSLGEDSLFITHLTKGIKNIELAPPNVVYNCRSRNDSASRKPISNWKQIQNSVLLTLEYARLYLLDIRHNDFKFYMSRIVASLLKAVSKKYRTV